MWWVASSYVVASCPTTPDPSRGMVHPVNEHGRIFYVTTLESALASDLVFEFFAGFFVVSAVILIVFNPFAESSGQK
jgi:hypothetical protein